MAEEYLSTDPNAGLQDEYLSTDPSAGLEQPKGGVVQNALAGAGDVIKGFAQQLVPDLSFKHLATIAYGPINAQIQGYQGLKSIVDTAQQVREAEKTEPYSRERFAAGFNVAGQLGLLALGARKPTIKEIATGEKPVEAMPQTPEPPISETVQPLTEAAVPKVEEVIPNAEQIQGPARANVDVQLPGGAVAREVYGGEMPADVGGEGVPPRGQGETLQQTPQEVDKIVGAALKTQDGKVYSGNNHYTAMAEVPEGVAPESLSGGWVTESGRFIPEEGKEAQQIAGSKQLNAQTSDVMIGKEVAAPVPQPEQPANQVRAAVDRMDFGEQHAGASDLASDLEKIQNLPQPLKKALDDFREAQVVDREQYGERSGLVSEHGDILESEARKWASPESKAEVATTAETAEIDVSPLLKAKSEAEATPILGDLMIKAKTNADIAQIKSAYERWKSSPQAPKGGTGIPLEGKPKPTEVGPQVGRPASAALRDVNTGEIWYGEANHGLLHDKVPNINGRQLEAGFATKEGKWISQAESEQLTGMASADELFEMSPQERKQWFDDQRYLVQNDDSLTPQERSSQLARIDTNEQKSKSWQSILKGGEQLPQVGRPEEVAAEPPPPAAPPPVETAVAPEVPQKASKIGKSIEAKAVEAKLTEGFKDTALYDPISIADQSQRATSFVRDNPILARAVVRGEVPLPEGLRGTPLITAMEEELIRKPDAKLAYELANSPLVSETSAAAQEMRLMSERVPDSITAKFNEIKEARKAGSKLRGETSEQIFQEIQKEVVRQSSKRPTWEAFVKSIEC